MPVNNPNLGGNSPLVMPVYPLRASQSGHGSQYSPYSPSRLVSRVKSPSPLAPPSLAVTMASVFDSNRESKLRHTRFCLSLIRFCKGHQQIKLFSRGGRRWYWPPSAKHKTLEQRISWKGNKILFQLCCVMKLFPKKFIERYLKAVLGRGETFHKYSRNETRKNKSLRVCNRGASSNDFVSSTRPTFGAARNLKIGNENQPIRSCPTQLRHPHDPRSCGGEMLINTIIAEFRLYWRL